MPRRQREDVDIEPVSAAVARIVDADQFDRWLLELPDHVLVAVAAPLEMLGFHYHLTPRQDVLLVRAARVVWDAVADLLGDCPDDLAGEFALLGAALGDRSVAGRGGQV
ncbi:hypothetical protein ACIBG6_12025 [Streptomyces sp. NPDC050842]|uniref:hypothetical protein n=1 Tax=Streptomyces sp. NPDC050842 TaxID=3365636 RepID=UPI0037AF64FD